MSRILLLSAVLVLPIFSHAGNLPVDQRDCDLIPGDFGKPVVITLIPGAKEDPTQQDDPDIIIDEDGPSEDDQGMIYIGFSAFLQAQRLKPATPVGLDH
ncbi:MAG: hypothetical protein WC326_01195 [Candidatus Delongbacteria bacterium]